MANDIKETTIALLRHMNAAKDEGLLIDLTYNSPLKQGSNSERKIGAHLTIKRKIRVDNKDAYKIIYSGFL